MFLRQLSSSGSSFLPRSRPALCRAGYRSSSASTHLPHFIPTPHPCWSVRGFPPWPPRLPYSHPAAHQAFSGRTLHPRNIHPGNFGGRWRSFYTSAVLMMDRPDRDREPPLKRRKSAEEKRSVEEREGHRGGAAGTAGGSKREHHHLDSRTDSRPQPNHRFKDGSRDRGRSGAGKGVSRESSRDKDVERTRTGDKDRPRKDHTARDETPNPRRSAHQQEGHKESQSRTQTPKSIPEQDKAPMHKPNPWFKQRGAEEQGRCERNPNPWQVARANREPPPPGTCPPVGQQENDKPLKCKFSLLRRFCMI